MPGSLLYDGYCDEYFSMDASDRTCLRAHAERARGTRQSILSRRAVIALLAWAQTRCRGRHWRTVIALQAFSALVERRRANRTKITGRARHTIRARCAKVTGSARTHLIQSGRTGRAVLPARARIRRSADRAQRAVESSHTLLRGGRGRARRAKKARQTLKRRRRGMR